MIIAEINLYLYLNYDNNGVLDVGKVEINLSLKESNQEEQEFQNNDK